jgi:hypothetical protein
MYGGFRRGSSQLNGAVEKIHFKVGMFGQWMWGQDLVRDGFCLYKAGDPAGLERAE